MSVHPVVAVSLLLAASFGACLLILALHGLLPIRAEFYATRGPWSLFGAVGPVAAELTVYPRSWSVGARVGVSVLPRARWQFAASANVGPLDVSVTVER